MMKKLRHTLLFLGISISTFAQTMSNGKIKGALTDEASKSVEFATVTLHRTLDSMLVKAVFTDDKGIFEIENIKEGSYFLRISNTGFKKFKSPNFQINAENLFVDLKSITLQSEATKLDEVAVRAAKPFIERQLDKIVVNVENSIVAAGNSVLEVLERSPGIVVNQESSINLKGKSGLIVMLDGKISPLSGADLIQYLKGIPAANIQSIEIISNPSARYDAAGNAGIINIKFKKDQKQGFNGSLSLSFGQGELRKPQASTNFNFRKKSWNLFGSYAHSQPVNFTRFFINRKFYDEARNLKATFVQDSYVEQPIFSHNARIGVDYSLSKKTILGVMANTNWNSNGRDGNTDTFIKNPDESLQQKTISKITLDDGRFNGFANSNFKHSFDTKGHELTADIDFGQYSATTLQDINNQSFNAIGTSLPSSRINSDQIGSIEVRSFKIDYVRPFSKKAKIETGFKTSTVSSDNDLKFYNFVNQNKLIDPLQSNQFKYKEHIDALYTSFANQMEKFDIQAGLRMEHTKTNGNQVTTGEVFSRQYVSLFPNLALNWKHTETNQLGLTYARRIDRPSYRQLNPFKIFVDLYTFVVGDPKLLPTFSNNFELSHTYKGNYVTALSYTRSLNVITDIFVQDDKTKISNQIPANIQDFDQWNLNFYVPVRYKKWLNSTITANLNWNKYQSPLQGANLLNQNSAWDVRMSNNIALGKGWSAELNAFYQSRQPWGLFIIKSLGQVTTGLQKVSNDKNSTFKLAMSDIFSTNHVAVEVNYQNMDFFTDRTWDSRVLTFSYSYRFGKSTVTRARQRNSGVEDEKRRAGN